MVIVSAPRELEAWLAINKEKKKMEEFELFLFYQFKGMFVMG